MNPLFRYSFKKELEPDLLTFLNVAKEQKNFNPNCNLDEYSKWSKILPLDPSLKEKLEIFENFSVQTPTIVLDSDSGSEEDNLSLILELVSQEKLSVSDTAFAIKETLETQNFISDSLKGDVLKLSGDEVEDLCLVLGENLNVEEVCALGEFFQGLENDELTLNYLRHLLIKKLFHDDNNDKIVTLLNQIIVKLPEILKEELLIKLFEVEKDSTDIKHFLHYLTTSDSHFQSAVLRDFVFGLEELHEKSLEIIENLLNRHVEYDTLNKLIELSSNHAEDHKTDKKFGKLLISVVKHLGANIVHLEQPIRRIISCHDSIWKAKLEKSFDLHFKDSLLFSQSFRSSN